MSGDAPAPSGAAPTLDERACDVACAGFALWTLCCHAVVAAGGGLHQLLATAAVAAGLALPTWLWARRRARSQPTGPEAPDGAATRARAGRIAAGLAPPLVLAALALWPPVERPLALWWAGALLLVAAAIVTAPQSPAAGAPRRDRASAAALWVLAAGCAAVALVCHRPDIDDAFYVNVAVTAADHPARALLRSDAVHGLHELPLHQPAYRLHSYELANGALSYLTGVPAIYVFHCFSAAAVALFVPLAHARLFRLLTPRHWPWAVAALLFVLLAAGETHRWYGNFALVRSWQGKAAFLFVFMPLVYAAAIRFALRPTPRAWLLLAAAQIAALGSSSTALWTAPAGAGVAMASALRPDRSGLRRLALGATASVYLLGAGWGLRETLQAYSAPLFEEHARGEPLALALVSALGDHRLLFVALACALGGWALCPRGLARRFAVAFPLAVWCLLLNPYWDGWVGANLTGPSYWRAMWSLPLPALMALVLIVPLRASARRPALARAAVLALAAAFAAWVPSYAALSRSNPGAGQVGIRFGPPALKVPPLPYAWAARLNASVEPGDAVVAPLAVSRWIPTFHHHANALVVRPAYLFRYRELLGEDELSRRDRMTRYTAGLLEGPDAHRVFRRGLEQFDVKGVCLRIGDHSRRARAILRDQGFRRTLQQGDYELWVRS